MAPPRLIIEGIGKVFGRIRAVDNVSLSISGGQFVGVIGRSGAGKSTLLRLVNRLSEPSNGRILWDGTDVSALHGWQLRDWRRRCAMIFQQFNLVGRLDVMNNVLMGRLAYAPAWQSLPKLWRRFSKLRQRTKWRSTGCRTAKTSLGSPLTTPPMTTRSN
jgi:phosphonate transport system ATP-binding protein